MPLYISRDILAKNDQQAAAATTSGLVDDITAKWAQATAPDPPSYSLPDLSSLGVTGAPNPVMSAIGAVPQLGQRAQQAVSSALSWTLPTLESLGVTQPQPVPMPTASATPDVTFEDGRQTPQPSMQPGESVGSVTVTSGPRATSPSGPAPETGGDLRAYGRAQAQRYGVDPDIFERQITQESGWNPRAVSSAGAKGLGQFMPGTASSYGLTDPFDPYASLDAAARHMADNLKRNGGDYARALAAYNAGQGAVDQYNGVPPYAETQNYIRIIMGPGRSAPTAGAAQSSAPAAPPSPAASVPTPPQAAGGSDMVTIENVDDGKRKAVPSEQVPSWLRPVVPGMPPSWRVVEGPVAQASALDEARASVGGGSTMMKAEQPADEADQSSDETERRGRFTPSRNIVPLGPAMRGVDIGTAYDRPNAPNRAVPGEVVEWTEPVNAGEGLYPSGARRNAAVAGSRDELDEMTPEQIEAERNFGRDPWLAPPPNPGQGYEGRAMPAPVDRTDVSGGYPWTWNIPGVPQINEPGGGNQALSYRQPFSQQSELPPDYDPDQSWRRIHSNVIRAFRQANGRMPSTSEVAELETLGYGAVR